MAKIRNRFWLFILSLIVLVLLDVFLLLPATFKECIFPDDSALFAANGAFFMSVFKDLPNVISSPVNWMWDYYQQYPALSIRRHPPIFGLVESIMFALFGISAVTAKVTILLFSILLIIGWFFALHKMFKDQFIAFFSVLLMISLPWSVRLGSSVWLDIPSMMFFAWACYFYASHLDSLCKSYKYIILTSIFLALSLYTYQLTMFGIIALFVYTAINDWKNIFKRRHFYIPIFLMILMLPLVFLTLKFARESLNIIYSGVPKDALHFVPVQSRLSLENWSFYLRVLWRFYPVPTIGLVLWGVTKMRVRPQKHELFFLLWFLIGYIGFTIIPAKVSRYPYHFAIAALPLTVIGIRDSFGLITSSWASGRHFSKYKTIPILIMFLWNVSLISQNREFYVQGIDSVTRWIVCEHNSENILYNGAFESAFIFYTRKYDTERNFRVLRTGNEFNQPDKIIDDIKQNKISIVVFESQNLREKGIWGGIYDLFYAELNSVVHQESLLEHLKDFPVLYGQPGKEKQLLLRVYRVGGV